MEFMCKTGLLTRRLLWDDPASISISEQTIALLTLCQQLQFDKDGIRRPSPDKAAVGVDEAFESFARQIQKAFMYASMTGRLLAMQGRLAEIGMRLEQQGRVEIHAGEGYAEATLNWLASTAGNKAV